MQEVLLTSEKFVKSVTSISENVAGQYLLPSIREAQEMGLRGILGDTLTESLKTKVQTRTLDGLYQVLIDKIQYYLAYMAVVRVCGKVAYKVGNMGVVKTSDEHVENVTHDDLGKVIYYWQSMADKYCYDLQTWLLENREEFPELDEDRCRRMRANLTSAATCGIWLGGARGRRIRGGCL
ncbi:MAG: hypothetical protein NC115_12170 [Bacteroidales bacterium]|nr:hypothetical protein [Bacteroidales bacterium]